MGSVISNNTTLFLVAVVAITTIDVALAYPRKLLFKASNYTVTMIDAQA